jgi:hypothetical protein
MTYEANEILQLLGGSPEVFYSRREISRSVGGRELYVQNPHWIVPHIQLLLDMDLIEKNDSGHYRIKSDERR